MCLVLPEEVTYELKKYDKTLWGSEVAQLAWGKMRKKLVEIEVREAN